MTATAPQPTSSTTLPVVRRSTRSRWALGASASAIGGLSTGRHQPVPRRSTGTDDPVRRGPPDPNGRPPPARTRCGRAATGRTPRRPRRPRRVRLPGECQASRASAQSTAGSGRPASDVPPRSCHGAIPAVSRTGGSTRVPVGSRPPWASYVACKFCIHTRRTGHERYAAIRSSASRPQAANRFVGWTIPPASVTVRTPGTEVASPRARRGLPRDTGLSRSARVGPGWRRGATAVDGVETRDAQADVPSRLGGNEA